MFLHRFIIQFFQNVRVILMEVLVLHVQIVENVIVAIGSKASSVLSVLMDIMNFLSVYVSLMIFAVSMNKHLIEI